MERYDSVSSFFFYSSGVWCYFFFVRSIPIGPRHYALLSDMIVLSRFGRQSLVVDIKESGFSFSFDSILVTLRATATAEE